MDTKKGVIVVFQLANGSSGKGKAGSEGFLEVHLSTIH